MEKNAKESKGKKLKASTGKQSTGTKRECKNKTKTGHDTQAVVKQVIGISSVHLSQLARGDSQRVGHYPWRYPDNPLFLLPTCPAPSGIEYRAQTMMLMQGYSACN